MIYLAIKSTNIRIRKFQKVDGSSDQHIKINSISLHQQSPTRIIKTKKIPLKIATEPINFLVVNQEYTKPQWDIWNSHEGKNKWSE